jgi:hypothetical protein
MTTIMKNPCYAINLGENQFAGSGWYYVVATSEKNAQMKLAHHLGAYVDGRISRKALNIVECDVHHKEVIY